MLFNSPRDALPIGMRCRPLYLSAVIVLVAVIWTGPGIAQEAAAASSSSTESLTVAENANSYGQWPTLDPAVDPSETGNVQYLDAIYGDLFEQSPTGHLIPDLATGSAFINGGKTYAIYLRHNVKFSDGTPFNASAVAYSIERDINPKNGCTCLSAFNVVSSVTTSGPYTVDLNLAHLDAQIEYSFLTYAPNYTIDPTAFRSMGASAYGLHPVGAGPFEVVSDEPDSKLVLRRNPGYWQSGHPHLESLTFTVVGNDTSAYDALVTGQAQAYQGYSSISELSSLSKSVRVTAIPALFGPSMIALNMRIPPFNNQLAREAIYYATDPKPIDRALDSNRGIPAESPTIPGGLYYEAKVPGYRTYNLAKAKAIVKQLGGLKFTILGSQHATQEDTMEALKTQWSQAGIDVTIGPPLATPSLDAQLASKKWQASLEGAGGFDPAIGIGLTFWYTSTAYFGGIDDPTLDSLITSAAEIQNPRKQDQAYRGIWKYISDKAYTPFLYATPMFDLSTKSVSAPGLTSSGYEILWPDASVKQ